MNELTLHGGREELIDADGGQWMNGERVAYALAASPCEVVC